MIAINNFREPLINLIKDDLIEVPNISEINNPHNKHSLMGYVTLLHHGRAKVFM